MTSLTRRLVRVDGAVQPVQLEEAFWNCLEEIARTQSRSVDDVVQSIAADHKTLALTSALRVGILFRFVRPQELAREQDGAVRSVRRGRSRIWSRFAIKPPGAREILLRGARSAKSRALA